MPLPDRTSAVIQPRTSGWFHSPVAAMDQIPSYPVTLIPYIGRYRFTTSAPAVKYHTLTQASKLNTARSPEHHLTAPWSNPS